jgi:hypothetical protein
MARKAKKRYPGVKASSFALPGRRYPINTKKRARNALSRVAQHGTPAQKATVRRKVARKYPSINVSGARKRRSR